MNYTETAPLAEPESRKSENEDAQMPWPEKGSLEDEMSLIMNAKVNDALDKFTADESVEGTPSDPDYLTEQVLNFNQEMNKKYPGIELYTRSLYHVLVGSTPIHGRLLEGTDLPGGEIQQFIREVYGH
jgi:hypothetical protein